VVCKVVGAVVESGGDESRVDCVSRGGWWCDFVLR